MTNVEYEYSRDLPQEAAGLTFADGEPILYAYECVLLERDTGERYIYTAVNLKTGRKEILSRRQTALLTSEVEKTVGRIRLSKVAGASWIQADRPVKNHIGKNKAREIMNALFRFILPKNGYAVREEQIALAHKILDAIEKQGVLLCEAGTGTGKTEGYLIPAIIAKRGRLNDDRNANLYRAMPYAEISRMPIVIATSSIALQRAILTEYIPRLSQILIDSGVIKEPLTAVLRKGKENYICRKNLQEHLLFESNSATRRVLESLLLPSSPIDLAEADLTPYVKRKIAVSGRCSDICKYRESCPYLAFREEAQSSDIDIQVCNHNYLLADTRFRTKGQSPLIPNYQLLILDEAHRFLGVARDMYGSELSGEAARDILNNAGRLTFTREELQNTAVRTAKSLFDQSAKLFDKLAAATAAKPDAEAETKSVTITDETARHIRGIRDLAEKLLSILRCEAFYCKSTELLAWVRKKYGADTSAINLRLLLAETGDEAGDRESQRQLTYAQMLRLNRAICDLPEIRRKAALEREQRMARLTGFNTGRRLYASNNSVLLDTVWKKTKRLLPVESASGKGSDRAVRLIWQIQALRDKAAELAKHEELITWLETDDDETRLCAIPNNINERLFKDQWGKGIPTILTSGTLSAAGYFTRTKHTLGLEPLGGKLAETTHQSPFDYQNNTLLYISECTPKPDNRNKTYIDAITSEIERLIRAAHGHTAVLFTSYDVMGRVYAELGKRELPFPMFRLDKGGVKEIERFKQSRNGVLLASGSMWEGIDIPGDALSMLIIVRLPFQTPDAIGEFERKQYASFPAYLNSVLVPEMLIKLKQGFGRLIRKEDDTGVVAILDSRANSHGAYRERVLAALPNCRVTNLISDVIDFFHQKKSPEYLK
jgi:Rad3-related DNA helicase